MKVFKQISFYFKKKNIEGAQKIQPLMFVFAPTVVPLNYIINMKYKHCKYTMFTFTHKT